MHGRKNIKLRLPCIWEISGSNSAPDNDCLIYLSDDYCVSSMYPPTGNVCYIFPCHLSIAVQTQQRHLKSIKQSILSLATKLLLERSTLQGVRCRPQHIGIAAGVFISCELQTHKLQTFL